MNERHPQRKLWFKARPFGWGWYPSSKEGWGVVVAYIGLIVLFALTIDESSPPREVAFTFVLPVLFVTILLLRIAYKTGEKPRWRWAGTDVSPQTSHILWIITIVITLFAIASAAAAILNNP